MSRIVVARRIMWGTLLAILVIPAVGLAQVFPAPIRASKVRADALLKSGRLDATISLYEKVVEKEPRFANAYYNLATAYYLKGELRKAAESLKAFLNLEPKDAEALYNLGCLKIRLGNFDEAMKCFLKAENCPCTRLVSRKIKEALRFTKDLRSENPETQKLITYLLTGSAKALFSAAD